MTPSALLSALDTLLEAANRRAKERALAPLEAQLETSAAAYFRTQGAGFLRAFAAKHRGRMLREAARDPFTGWEASLLAASTVPRKRFLAALDRLIRRSVVEGATFGEKELASGESGLGLSFNLKNPRAVAFLQDYAAERISGIDDTTRDRMRRLLAKAADEGWSYDRVAKQIKERFTGFDDPKPHAHIRSRAHLVAVQEVGNGFEAGHRMLVDELADAGLVMEKSMITAGDDRVAAECVSNAGAGWIPLESDFPGGVQRAPEQHPACRCATTYRRKPGRVRG